MSRILDRLHARLPAVLRRRVTPSNGRLVADLEGLAPLSASAIRMALAEDPLAEEQVLEVADEAQDLAGLTAALQGRGLPVRGIVKTDDAPGLLFVLCGHGAARGWVDASPAEMAAIADVLATEKSPPRPAAIARERLREVLRERRALLDEEDLFADDLAELEVERAALKAELEGGS